MTAPERIDLAKRIVCEKDEVRKAVLMEQYARERDAIIAAGRSWQ